MARYIFITGGVVSSLGKGLLAASLGALLQARGYSARIRKFDPYLNVDPGTMSPYQHGEVYVTDDGAETDLDLGHYERFTGVASRQSDNVTSGRIYRDIIARERRGDIGDERGVDEAALAATQIVLQLPNRLDERQAFNIADRPADFADNEVEPVRLRLGEILDGVRDVRDHLHGCAEVIAAAFARDDVAIDTARRDIVRLA